MAWDGVANESGAGLARFQARSVHPLRDKLLLPGCVSLQLCREYKGRTLRLTTIGIVVVSSTQLSIDVCVLHADCQ